MSVDSLVKEVATIAGVEPTHITQCKHFFFVNDSSHTSYVTEQQQQMLLELSDYYSVQVLKEQILPITEDNIISLRIVDWLCTNYSKSKNITYLHEGEVVHLHSLYKTYLKTHKRKSFDPFRRRTIVWFFVPPRKQPYSTTCGQLQYFLWARKYGVLKYAMDNFADIEKDMQTCIARSKVLKSLTKKKRVKLSSNGIVGFSLVNHNYP